MAHSQDAPSQPTPVFPFSRPYSLPDSASKSYGAATSQPVSPANPNWIDRSSTASLPLPSQTPYNLLPRMTDTTSAGSSQWVSDSRRGLGEPSERRPLPMRPTTQTADCPSKPSYPSSNLQSSLPSPAPVPSSPPPPYSRFLPPEQPMPTTRSLTRSVSSTSGYPAPEAPVILTPPPQAESEQGERRRAPHDSFLCHAPPPDTWIAIESSLSEYTLTVRLPGFRRDGITLATRRRRILHVVANSWEPGGGHFERRVSFGYDADLAQVRAEFDGEMLRIIVPRRPSHVSTFSGL
ncbi:hypothetical protein BJ138DRAFT_1002653 [Hygrophoropsis aurantiaca]|uniref:Uncharacterized protein n=1 Tax=Hygrophoropsis aurantiaca TaxID=72124 RepID=A0ACB8AJ65_9AGAM|nr:hypothetical protein BJ138DRAFT_1002653 [Hygrophoropsis aurantiaca]